MTTTTSAITITPCEHHVRCGAALRCGAGAARREHKALVGGALVAVIVAPITAVLASSSSSPSSAAAARRRRRAPPGRLTSRARHPRVIEHARHPLTQRSSPAGSAERLPSELEDVMPGQQVTVSDPQGNHFTVTVPQNIQPGMIYARVPLPARRAAAARRRRGCGRARAVAAEGTGRRCHRRRAAADGQHRPRRRRSRPSLPPQHAARADAGAVAPGRPRRAAHDHQRPHPGGARGGCGRARGRRGGGVGPVRFCHRRLH